jgi:transposase
MIVAMAKQRCFYHLAGDLEKTDKQNDSEQWCLFRKKLYRLMNDAIRLSQNGDTVEPDTYVRQTKRFHDRMDLLIVQPNQDKDVIRHQKRLSRHRDEMFSFQIYNVSPYNNHAEQQIRRPVIMRKISQQNRSNSGAMVQAVLMSLFKSFDMQGLNPIETVLTIAKAAISGKSIDEQLIDIAA